MLFSQTLFPIAGVGYKGLYGGTTLRLFDKYRRDELQFEHWADDWDEEDDANGWRCRA